MSKIHSKERTARVTLPLKKGFSRVCFTASKLFTLFNNVVSVSRQQ
jgi:hypothetical protein